MAKLLKYLITGIVFGIILTKAEVISWFKIYEMFRFQSFHMYGVISSAVATGIILLQLSMKFKLKTIDGSLIFVQQKPRGTTRYLAGGIIFGLGWALTGACPGPLFILLGNGFSVVTIMITAALVGTYVYGVLRKYIPH